MAESPKRERRTTTFRGKTIQWEADMVHVGGVPVHFEHTEDGVHAHMEATYQVYGSPEELGEDLIRQWGAAQIDRQKPPAATGMRKSRQKGKK